MPRGPNLNSLRMFDAAARHLNFRRAGEELNLTQGAVAQQVRALESALGTRLFERLARGLTLTDTGRRYHVSIHQALTLIAEANRDLSAKSNRVTLSVPPSFASKWLVPRLADFAERHPTIDVATIATEKIADFRTDGVDLAIRQGAPVRERGLVSQQLAPLDLRAVCAPSFAIHLPPLDGLEGFAPHPLIQDSYAYWEVLFDQAGLAPKARVLRFNQTGLAMDAAANGQGIALAPRLLVEEEFDRGRLIDLWSSPGSENAGFHLLQPRGVKAWPARDTLTNWISEAIAETLTSS